MAVNVTITELHVLSNFTPYVERKKIVVHTYRW